MKQIIYILIFLLLAGSGRGLYAQTIYGNWIDNRVPFDEDGKGNNSGNAILIQHAGHLAHLAWKVNTGTTYENKYFKLTADINLRDRYWTPIGTNDTPTGYFNGHFDGNNCMVTYLTVAGAENLQGLFGVIGSAATIQNLFVTKCNISGRENVGALAGKNNGAVLRCFATGTVTATGNNGGGLIGVNTKTGKVTECYSTCAVTGNWTTGGTWDNPLTCGGLIGNNDEGIVTRSYATGSVTIGSKNFSGYATIGGFTGINNGLVKECFSAGAVCVNNNGGFTGDNNKFGVYLSCVFDRQGTGQETASRNDHICTAANIIAANTSDLTSGKLPPGFAPEAWIAQRGLYPQLRWFAELSIRDFYIGSAISAVPFPTVSINENAGFVRTSFPLIRRFPLGSLGDVYYNFSWRSITQQTQNIDLTTTSRNDSIFGWVNCIATDVWYDLAFPGEYSPYDRIIKFKPATQFSHRQIIVNNQIMTEGRELKIKQPCDVTPRDVSISIQTSIINRVSVDNVYLPQTQNRMTTVYASSPGIIRKTIRLYSYRGEIDERTGIPVETVDTYTISVERPFYAEQIFAPQRWRDVLTINNNFATNGGFIIHGYEWYKDGRKLPTDKGYIHEPGGLDPAARYTALLTIDTPEGRDQVSTCPAVITAESETKLAVYPNPVARGQTFRIVTGAAAPTGSQTVVRLFDATGNTISTGTFAGNVTEYAAPDTPGHYILQVTADGVTQNVKIVIY